MKKYFMDLLRSGNRFMGPFIQIPCPELVEIVGHAGFDYVIIDHEHGIMGTEQMLHLIRTCDSIDLPSIIRVPEITEDHNQKGARHGGVG